MSSLSYPKRTIKEDKSATKDKLIAANGRPQFKGEQITSQRTKNKYAELDEDVIDNNLHREYLKKQKHEKNRVFLIGEKKSDDSDSDTDSSGSDERQPTYGDDSDNESPQNRDDAQ